MEEKYTLELTRDEILMLQELTSDTEHSYIWMQKIAESLNNKAMAAYQKPTMSKEVLEQEVARERISVYLKVGDNAANEMARAKRNELHFYYQITEENEQKKD